MSTASAESEPSPTLTAKQAQGERSREEILEAAEALMSAKGYAATSISDLAKASGLPASSIYWHFGSKSGVLGAVMERGATRFFHDRTLLDPDGDPDPRTRLAAMLGNCAEVIGTHPRFLRLCMLLLLGSEGEHAQQAVVDRVRAEAKQVLGLGLRNAYAEWGPEVAGAVAEHLVDYLLASWDGLFIATQAGDARSTSVLIEQMVDSVHRLAETVRNGVPPSG
jgi:AcrR family transcriptional regulator